MEGSVCSMTVTVWLWIDIVTNICYLAMVVLACTWLVTGVITNRERRNAYKQLQKGFHIQYTNVDSVETVEEVVERISEKLKEMAKE